MSHRSGRATRLIAKLRTTSSTCFRLVSMTEEQSEEDDESRARDCGQCRQRGPLPRIQIWIAFRKQLNIISTDQFFLPPLYYGKNCFLYFHAKNNNGEKVSLLDFCCTVLHHQVPYDIVSSNVHPEDHNEHYYVISNKSRSAILTVIPLPENHIQTKIQRTMS